MIQARLDSLLHDLPPERAAIVREFARRPQDEQLIYMFMQIGELKEAVTPKPLQARLYEMGTWGAFIAYVLFDKRAHLPFIGDDK